MRIFEAKVRTDRGVIDHYHIWASCPLDAKRIIEEKYGPHSLLSFPIEDRSHHARTSIWEDTDCLDRGLYRTKK